MSWLDRIWALLGLGDATPDPKSARLTEEAALGLAQEAVEKEGQPWIAPYRATLKLEDGRKRWFVETNADSIGHRTLVVIDDETQQVVRVRALPR